MFSIVTWQSKVESDFAWIMFRRMTKIQAKCSCNRRIMGGVTSSSSIYMCLSNTGYRTVKSRPAIAFDSCTD